MVESDSCRFETDTGTIQYDIRCDFSIESRSTNFNSFDHGSQQQLELHQHHVPRTVFFRTYQAFRVAAGTYQLSSLDSNTEATNMKSCWLALSLPLLGQKSIAFSLLTAQSTPTHRFASHPRKTFPSTSSLASSLNKDNAKEWQADLDELLSPLTPPGRRQILFQELLNASQEIRASVQKALQERDVSYAVVWIFPCYG